MPSRKYRPRILNSWWHRCKIKRQARKDGKLGIPKVSDQGLSQFERGLVAQAQQAIEYADGRYVEQINQLQRGLASAIERMARYAGQFKHKFEQYEEKQVHLGRGVTIHLAKSWYLILLAVVVVGELAFNFQAFQVFQKPLALTFLMALGVAVTLPASAHFIGIWIKQWPVPVWRTAIYVVIALAVGLGAISGINLARSEYLRLLDSGLPAEEDVLQYAFMLVNLLVFSTAILMSYFAHDADPEIEKLREEFRHLDRRCHFTNGELNALDGKLETARAKREADLRSIEAILKELLQLYRTENQTARQDRSLPASFTQATEGLLTRRTELGGEGISREDIVAIKNRWFEVDKDIRARLPMAGSE